MKRLTMLVLVACGALAATGAAGADPGKNAFAFDLACNGTTYHVVSGGSGGAAHDADSNAVLVLKGITVADPDSGTRSFMTPGFSTDELTTCTGAFVNSLGHAAPFTAYVLSTRG